MRFQPTPQPPDQKGSVYSPEREKHIQSLEETGFPMDCVAMSEAAHLHDHCRWLKFSAGVSGEIDLRDIVF
jgi:hypothetical protein